MMNNVTNGQLELTLGSPASLRPRRFRSHRQPGAAWWFAQMHAAVDRANDWQNNPPVPVSPPASQPGIRTPNAHTKIAA